MLIVPKQIVNVNGLLKAKTLVDPNQIEISISLLNPINRSVRINKNTCITDLDPVESVHHKKRLNPLLYANGQNYPIIYLHCLIKFQMRLVEQRRIKSNI